MDSVYGPSVCPPGRNWGTPIQVPETQLAALIAGRKYLGICVDSESTAAAMSVLNNHIGRPARRADAADQKG
jgi:hypothetical protein